MKFHPFFHPKSPCQGPARPGCQAAGLAASPAGRLATSASTRRCLRQKSLQLQHRSSREREGRLPPATAPYGAARPACRAGSRVGNHTLRGVMLDLNFVAFATSRSSRTRRFARPAATLPGRLPPHHWCGQAGRWVGNIRLQEAALDQN